MLYLRCMRVHGHFATAGPLAPCMRSLRHLRTLLPSVIASKKLEAPLTSTVGSSARGSDHRRAASSAHPLSKAAAAIAAALFTYSIITVLYCKQLKPEVSINLQVKTSSSKVRHPSFPRGRLVSLQVIPTGLFSRNHQAQWQNV